MLLINTKNFSQNRRDIFLRDSIWSKSNGWNKIEKKTFANLIKNIEQLEKEYNTYEADIRYSLLQSAYASDEIDFFKEQLSICVEKYGVQVPYMTEKENYYDAIMKGNLASWFKEMYLEKHMIWIKNNFDKQIDLKRLNALHEKDQFVDSFAINLINNMPLDSVQQTKELKILSEYFFKSAAVLFGITQKWKAYPTAKSFAIIQNPTSIVETHNQQSKYNFERFYLLFFDYYKKAYLDNDLYYTYFDNFDFHSYRHFGYSIFNKLYKKDIQKEWWTTNKDPNEDIPIKDIKFSNQIKKEFKW
jgi:hypothetical protein